MAARKMRQAGVVTAASGASRTKEGEGEEEGSGELSLSPSPEAELEAQRHAKKVPSTKKGRKANGTARAVKTVKRGRTAKPEGPYTKYKEAGVIPEPELTRSAEVVAGTPSLKLVCWNVGGLRAFLKKRISDLQELAHREQPDVIGILETKLQQDNTEASETALVEALPDYEIAALHCSTAKKGYSGLGVLLRKGSPKPLKVEAWDLPSAADEGRLVTLEFDKLVVVIAYVPNSGDGLKRLDVRIQGWDCQLRQKLSEISSSKATVLLGDLNVAHRDEDIWNVEAAHVAKSAGTTPQERASFTQLLDAGFVDGFRHIHPEALGAFTYWSVRAGNRKSNRGLRLDYVVVSNAMIDPDSSPKLVDAFHMPELATGDHCPVGATIALGHAESD
eukprot:gnl/TRDRNA2_/TRDRNA2_160653_c0_seq3.p1 gnl/TRDRNA2_/TRDRNA2_160653_c0~~gnl/TRDRNA2_/TRDRNA2_160653_c0_seq3.p1  ORF type:complete len:408 (-),score=77.27 gnl/TRDRNA2_/TRDRNA2_160653_c0_seq3:44-1213(-)